MERFIEEGDTRALTWFAPESPIDEGEDENEENQGDERVVDAAAMGVEREPGENQRGCEAERYGGEFSGHRFLRGFEARFYGISIGDPSFLSMSVGNMGRTFVQWVRRGQSPSLHAAHSSQA